MIHASMNSIWDPLTRFLERGETLLPVLVAVAVVLASGQIGRAHV